MPMSLAYRERMGCVDTMMRRLQMCFSGTPRIQNDRIVERWIVELAMQGQGLRL